MRSPPPRQVPGLDARRRLDRLSALPLRPASARLVLQAVMEGEDGPSPDALNPSRIRPIAEVDPGWALAESRPGPMADPRALIADRPWWASASEAGNEAIGRLWRHAVAVGLAARRLAREAGDDDPSRVARAGLLHGLGRWAVAAIEPDWLARWLDEPSPERRRESERRLLGSEMTTIGRRLAERWGADPLVADAAWLHDDRDDLDACASDPARLRLIRAAYRWAERTPWALAPNPEGREPAPSDPWLRLLVAEVQVRCGPAFVAADATPHEERLARAHARLLLEVDALRAGQAARDRLLDAIAGSDPADDPETWAERAGLAFCGLPGVATARVDWTGPGATARRDEPARALPPSHLLSLNDRGRPCAEVRLWADPARPAPSSSIDAPALRAAWDAWAASVAEHARQEARFESVLGAHRDRVADEEPRLLREKLAALAEFAAGAGHELNNPLAVIVGRAQLLLVRESDPASIRSLRAIIGQAQRAHRILRDLMYVARPPELRPRFCQPEEIVRACVRDIKTEAESRGVRLLAEPGEPGPKAWADPDALRHLAETLLRNALEATPKGGTVRLVASGDARTLRWTVEDDGRGIAPEEGRHILDPFYCGRKAGRGLGLGLPRAARVVAQAGGSLRWHSTPGRGTTFHLQLPLAEPPRPPA